MKLFLKYFVFLFLLYTVNCTLLTVGSVAEVGGVDIDVLSAKVGARPLGMGCAFTAISDNSDASYYNPAGLSFITTSELQSMQTRMSTDADHYYISYVTPFLKGALGLSWIQISLGDITQTTTTDAFNEVITTNIFSYFSNVYLLSYGLPLTNSFGVGLTAKYLTSDMTSVNQGQATGFSVTPGLLYKLISDSKNIGKIGFTLEDLLNEQKWGTGTTEKSIPKLKLGIALENLNILPEGSIFAFDLSQKISRKYPAELSFGYEWKNNLLALRMGWLETSSFTGGIGFSAKNNEYFTTQLDYAYVGQTSLSMENVHRISLIGKW